MNNVETLASMVGNKRALAHICEVDPSLVSRWIKAGHVAPAYNIRIKRALAEIAGTLDKTDAERSAWIARGVACLDAPVCPTCGREVGQLP